ncbi:MAG: alkaline phosphatase family protein [Marinilabiliaceae bacterium]|nr:alkaline phosphatase family protein [Marinilabiliaceae bacterium]
MKKLIVALTSLLMAASMHAQQIAKLCSEKPRLVLIIVVDNLNNEQLEIVRRECGRDGINRIYNHGTQFTNAYYDAGGNYAGKNLATLFTGAPASTHGIVGRQWIDSFTNKRVDAIYGDAINKDGKVDTLALPRNGQLLCSTIGNEIRKIYNHNAHIFSCGFHPEMLLWSSGTNMGEPVAWLDDVTGLMRQQNITDSATFAWLNDFNSKKMCDIYINKIWAPRNDINKYHEKLYFSNERGSARTFYYPMRSAIPIHEKYSLVAGSPFGNQLIRDFAASALLCGNFGKDDIPDILTVEFTAQPSCGLKKQPLDMETEDLLIGLDENIASLLKAIDSSIGMDNTLVVFTAAQGCYDIKSTDSEQWKSKGAVSMRRTTALLNLYLMAIHGQAQWVRNYNDYSIYLDRQLADERKVNWDTLLNESAAFLTQIKGIGDAFAAKDLRNIYSTSPVIEVLRRNYHPKRSGDILIHLEPGWASEQDDGSQLTQLWGQEFVPLAFYGWKVPRATIYERHNMADVAPTICQYIRVAQPNGCSGTPIKLKIENL